MKDTQNFAKVIVVLPKKEYEVLEDLARREMRSLSDQARWLMREELIRQGLVDKPEGHTTFPHKPPVTYRGEEKK